MQICLFYTLSLKIYGNIRSVTTFYNYGPQIIRSKKIQLKSFAELKMSLLLRQTSSKTGNHFKTKERRSNCCCPNKKLRKKYLSREYSLHKGTRQPFYIEIINIFTHLVESTAVKQEVSRAVILSLTTWVFSDLRHC